MQKFIFTAILFAFSVLFVNAQQSSEGSLSAFGKSGDLGLCPLQSTRVKAEISGMMTRVTVTQDFANPFNEPIEAVYSFPLSQNGAVDSMTMKIGERTIKGAIMRRDEARKVYEQAKQEGKAASLLTQQRPNIFRQSVANIMPGNRITVELSYVETLKFDSGVFEFVFPMTIGERYLPVDSPSKSAVGPMINQTRPGDNISIEVSIDAGAPVGSISSPTHSITTTNLTSANALIGLRGETTIPNKDFILRFDLAGKGFADSFLAHRAAKGGFFTLMLAPPAKLATEDITPKEIVFVLDTSGSMNGFPIEKAKEAIRLSLDGLNPQDTFNLITFAGDTSVLFGEPVPATTENLEAAKKFLDARQGAGGTEMMSAIRAALDPTDSKEHLRIVCFMTDGLIGNEQQILAEIQKHPKARIFSFGIGPSVNRFLLDKMAEEGKGEAEYVGPNDDGSAAAKRFFERVRTPLLTDISIDWNGLPVSDVMPTSFGDLFSAKPLVINGRYSKGGKGTITLRGTAAGQDFSRRIDVTLPESEPGHDVLATLWARRQIDAIMSKKLSMPTPQEGVNRVTELGLEFKLLTSYTSFVAVEDQIVNVNGTPTRVTVPSAEVDNVTRQGYIAGLRADQANNTLDGAAVMVESQSASLGTSFTANQLVSLPANTRSVANLLKLQPGVAANADAGKKRKVSPEMMRLSQSFARHQKKQSSTESKITIETIDPATGQTITQKGKLRLLAGEKRGLRADLENPGLTIAAMDKMFLISHLDTQTAFTGKLQNKFETALEFLLASDLSVFASRYTLAFSGTETIGDVKTSHVLMMPQTDSTLPKFEFWLDKNGAVIRLRRTTAEGHSETITIGETKEVAMISPAELKVALPKGTKVLPR